MGFFLLSAMSLRFRQPALDAEHRKRGTRSIAPLVEFGGTRPRPGLLLIVHSQNAVAERKFSRDSQIHQPARGFHRDDFEMDGFALDDAAERDRGVIGLSILLRSIQRDRNRRR